MTFNIGDKVRIVNYGHPLWVPQEWIDKGWAKGPAIGKTDTHTIIDTSPELVGQEGVVCNAHETQGRPTYAMQGPSKHAWYEEDQLELVTKNNVFP